MIGSGDIASMLPERDDLLFFASGVSNSQETSEAAYEREADLLLAQRRAEHIVYFGSLAVFYANTRYTEHKLEMEDLLRSNFDTHTIVRLGNITWGNNPHTLINYLKAHPEAPIRDEYRYIVEPEEFKYWIDLIPEWSCEMNITGRRMKVQEVVDEYVR